MSHLRQFDGTPPGAPGGWYKPSYTARSQDHQAGSKDQPAPARAAGSARSWFGPWMPGDIQGPMSADRESDGQPAQCYVGQERRTVTDDAVVEGGPRRVVRRRVVRVVGG